MVKIFSSKTTCWDPEKFITMWIEVTWTSKDVLQVLDQIYTERVVLSRNFYQVKEEMTRMSCNKYSIRWYSELISTIFGGKCTENGVVWYSEIFFIFQTEKENKDVAETLIVLFLIYLFIKWVSTFLKTGRKNTKFTII